MVRAGIDGGLGRGAALSATVTTTRAAEPRDRQLLFEVYASTRQEELAPLPWTDEQKQAFLAQQFAAQDSDYRQRYPAAQFMVVECDGAPIGRMYVTRLDGDELRLIDLAVLTEHRRRGIGSMLLDELLADADRAGLMVSLHVEHWNPARELYARRGFVAVSHTDVHVRMERPVTGVS